MQLTCKGVNTVTNCNQNTFFVFQQREIRERDIVRAITRVGTFLSSEGEIPTT